MAPQTRTQRQAAAKKAAATRKRNAARANNGTVKAAARRTVTQARDTGRSARTTSRLAVRSATRQVSAERCRLDALARQLERAVLIQVGAALEARDRIADFVETYGDPQEARRRLNSFERRGAAALRRNRTVVERRAKDGRDNVADLVTLGAARDFGRRVSLFLAGTAGFGFGSGRGRASRTCRPRLNRARWSEPH